VPLINVVSPASKLAGDLEERTLNPLPQAVGCRHPPIRGVAAKNFLVIEISEATVLLKNSAFYYDFAAISHDAAQSCECTKRVLQMVVDAGEYYDIEILDAEVFDVID